MPESEKEENPKYVMQGLKLIQDAYNMEQHMMDEQELSYEERAKLRLHLSQPILELSFDLKIHTLKY